MNTSGPDVGETYRSKSNEFLRRHGIGDGADYVITNASGDKFSLYRKHSNGTICPEKITLLKSVFGENFAYGGSGVRSMIYANPSHYFAQKVSAARPIWPSPLYE